MQTLNLYTVRVGNVGSFFAAAVDIEQARAIGEQWADERNIRHQTVRVKRFSDSRPVYTFAR